MLPTNPLHLRAGCVEGGKGAVEEPGFQQRVANSLKPVHVDAADTSLGAKWKRFRNAALSGISTDVHQVRRHGQRVRWAPGRLRSQAPGRVSCLIPNQPTHLPFTKQLIPPAPCCA